MESTGVSPFDVFFVQFEIDFSPQSRDKREHVRFVLYRVTKRRENFTQRGSARAFRRLQASKVRRYKRRRQTPRDARLLSLDESAKFGREYATREERRKAHCNECRARCEVRRTEIVRREIPSNWLTRRSAACAGEICEETCRKNLIRSKAGGKSTARQERTIENAGKYCEDARKVSMRRRNARATASPRGNDARKRTCKEPSTIEDFSRNGEISTATSVRKI